MNKIAIAVTLEDVKNADFIEVERFGSNVEKIVKLVRDGKDSFSYINHNGERRVFREEQIHGLIENKIWTAYLISIPQNKEDLINKESRFPSHYHSGDIDVFAFAEANCSTEELRGFYKINIFKYLARAEKKNGMEDYEKAERYLEELMKLVRKGVEG